VPSAHKSNPRKNSTKKQENEKANIVREETLGRWGVGRSLTGWGGARQRREKYVRPEKPGVTKTQKKALTIGKGQAEGETPNCPGKFLQEMADDPGKRQLNPI